MPSTAAYSEYTPQPYQALPLSGLPVARFHSRDPLGTVTRFRPVLRPPISAVIVIAAPSTRLAAVLTALHWCAEIIVLDCGSTPTDPAAIAGYPRVSLHRLPGEFNGLGRALRHGAALTRHDWILSIDPDEVVSPELAAEIGARLLEPDTVYTLPFFHYFGDRHVTTGGWSPERHARLFHRGVTDFCADATQGRVETTDLRIRHLRHPAHRYAYASLEDFIRQQGDDRHPVADRRAPRRPLGFTPAAARAAWMFFKSYFLQRGFLHGREGLALGAYLARRSAGLARR